MCEMWRFPGRAAGRRRRRRWIILRHTAIDGLRLTLRRKAWNFARQYCAAGHFKVFKAGQALDPAGQDCMLEFRAPELPFKFPREETSR